MRWYFPLPNPGANVFLERHLERQLQWHACFHHVLELIMEAAVAEKLGPTSGPRKKYFARFQTYFNDLAEEEKEAIRLDAPNHLRQVGDEDDVTREFLDATKAFFSTFVECYQRGDYLEFSRLIKVKV